LERGGSASASNPASATSLASATNPASATRPAGPASPQIVLISSGSEVALILAAAERLADQGISARVVSMPSHELFAAQDDDYRASVLPPGVPRLAIEAGHPMSWYRWVGDNGIVLGLERFGASAPYERIYEELGLTVDKIVAAAGDLVRLS
jgi:transketolase